MNKPLILSSIIAGSALLICTGAIGTHHISQARAHYKHEYNIERVTSNQYQNELAKRKAAFTKQIKYEHDSNYTQWTQNSFYHLRLNNITEAFFKNYYNFTNKKQAMNRPRVEAKYTTKNIRKNPGIFLYATDLHDNIGSQFKNVSNYVIQAKGNNLIDVADVQYAAWLTKGKDKNQPNTGEKWYVLCYNTKKNKITALKPYYREDNVKLQKYQL